MNGEERFAPARLRRWILQGVALGGLATAGVVVFTTNERTWEQLGSFHPFWLAVLGAMVVVAWLCNGARVWVLCRALGHRLRYRQALAVSLSQEFGIAATPAGIGGTVLRLTLLRHAGVPISRGGSMLATDAAIDLIFFALLTPFAIWVVLHERVFGRLIDQAERSEAPEIAVALLAALVVLVVLLRSRWFHRLLERSARATSFGRRKRLPARHRFLRTQAARGLRRLREALALLWGRRKTALLADFVLASVQWCCRYGLLPLILLAIGSPVHPLPLFLVQGLLFMLSLLVVAPGGGGSIEVLSALVLPQFVPTALVGFVVLVWRLFSYHLYLLGGGLAFFLAVRRLDRLFPPTDASPGRNADPASSR